MSNAIMYYWNMKKKSPYSIYILIVSFQTNGFSELPDTDTIYETRYKDSKYIFEMCECNKKLSRI